MSQSLSSVSHIRSLSSIKTAEPVSEGNALSHTHTQTHTLLAVKERERNKKQASTKVSDSKLLKFKLLTRCRADDADGEIKHSTKGSDDRSEPMKRRKDVCTFNRVLLTAKTEQQ